MQEVRLSKTPLFLSRSAASVAQCKRSLYHLPPWELCKVTPLASARSARLGRPLPIPLRKLDLIEQHRILEDIVLTRQEELRHSYPDIIQICAGNRTKTDKGGRRVLIKPPEACLIFVVTKKLKKLPEGRRTLPKKVLAVTRIGGVARLVSVPTDVEPRADIRRGTPDDAPVRIRAEFEEAASKTGMICCAVDRAPGEPGLRAIGCRHVFAAEGQLRALGMIASPVYLADDFANELGFTTNAMGRLDLEAGNLDAVLISVVDSNDGKGRLHAALGGITIGSNRPRTEAEGLADLNEIWVQTARGPVKLLKDLGIVNAPEASLPYPDGSGGSFACNFDSLLVYGMTEPGDLREGDSGSAVTTDKAGGRLLGMHIGSDQGLKRAYIIPVWHLLDGARYSLPVIDKLRLIDAATLPDAPVPVRTPLGPADATLGELSRRFETATQDPGEVSSGVGDAGGVSYGIYQLSTETGSARAFVLSPECRWRARLAPLTPGTPEFATEWRSIAQTERNDFAQAQHDYIRSVYYEVLREKLLQSGLDIDARSHALRDVVWSTAVQMGANTRIIGIALQKCGGLPTLQPIDKRNEEKFIREIYAERFAEGANGKLKYFQKSGQNQQEGLRRRKRDELQDALTMLTNDASVPS